MSDDHRKRVSDAYWKTWDEYVERLGNPDLYTWQLNDSSMRDYTAAMRMALERGSALTEAERAELYTKHGPPPDVLT